MSNDIYPNTIRGLTWNVGRSPEFSTIVQTSPSLIETSIIQAQNPRRRWELRYDYLKDNPSSLVAGLNYTDFDTLEAFILKHFGQGDSFLFDDIRTPDDFVGPALIAAAPNTYAQLQIIQDPISGIYYSPLQVNRGGIYWEDLDYVDTTRGFNIYANGVAKSWSFGTGGGPDAILNTTPGLAISGRSFAGPYLRWYGTAHPAAPVTAQFYYYWRVKFDTDQQEFEKFMDMLWTAGDRGGASIKLRGARAYIGGAQ